MNLTFKKFSLALLLIVSLISPINVYAAEPKPKGNIFTSNDFIIQTNNVNLIINNLYTNKNSLIIDGYIYNATNVTLSEITNFYLELLDSKGSIFARGIFDNIDISGSLYPNQGKRVTLSINDKAFNLKDVNLKSISWKFSYDYKELS